MNPSPKAQVAEAARQFTAGDRHAFKSLPPEALRFGAGPLDTARQPAPASKPAPALRPDAFAIQREAARVEAEQAAHAASLAVLFGVPPATARYWMHTGKIV